MIPLFIASAVRVINPDLAAGDAQALIPSLVSVHTPAAVQIIFFGALISAILSTCSGAILAPASILSENVIRPLLGRRLGERGLLRVLRLSVVLITGIALGMSLSRRNIYELVGESSILGLVSLLVPMTAAVYARKHSPTGAALSMLSGLLVWFTAEYLVETSIPSLVYGFSASLLAFVAGTWLDRSRHGEAIVKNVLHLSRTIRNTRKP
jgi:solute:Na+ symporter, SSS family